MKHLLSRHFPKNTLDSLSLSTMIDYLGFTFEDFPKDCVVVVENLPKLFDEDKLLRLFHPMGRIRVVGKAYGETSGEFHFIFLIATCIF